jgi:hypothetical protein
MTIAVNVLITDPLPVEDVYEVASRLVTGEGRTALYDHSSGLIENIPGQGFDARLRVYYGTDGPLTDFEPDSEFPDDEESAVRWPEPHAIRVWWDTPLGHEGPNGETAGDLLTSYVEGLGTWLDDRDVRWLWVEENSGEVFEGLTGLDKLRAEGASGRDLMTNVIAPIFSRAGAFVVVNGVDK